MKNYAKTGIICAVQLKPLIWVGPTQKVVRRFASEVRQSFGFALYQAQLGQKHVHAKPLRGFKGAGVLEIVENHEGDTFRTVYTVKFSKAVYVLHAFQKKSKTGLKTRKEDTDLVRGRIKDAERHYSQLLKGKGK